MKKRGERVRLLPGRPSVVSWHAHVGRKEKQGPLGDWFGCYSEDTTLGMPSWELAESRLQELAFEGAVAGAPMQPDMLLGGDLQNQCTAGAYAARKSMLPYVGLYGACSTMAESLALAGLMVEGGFSESAAAVTSSHFCSAERQYRFPLEYGSQRPPQSQWTVTGAGCAIVGEHRDGMPYIEDVMFGRIIDLGITDINNMGAAMAPAAADTLLGYFADTGTRPSDYDGIFTGDLGEIGSRLLHTLCRRGGTELTGHSDCGLMIFDRATQKVGSGGSGCGCSASVLCGYLLPKLRAGELRNILFIATGALMSPTLFQQGESIPGVAHLVHLRAS